jgi:hypothetical protein
LLGKKLELEMNMEHPLHVAVAKEIEKRLANRGEFFRDSACGGAQHLPLFDGPNKGRSAHMCDVDLVVVSEGHVKVIVEIEESGFMPTKICGKFLQSAFATYLIHDPRPEPKVPFGSNVLFVQVLDGSKSLPEGTQKKSQGMSIEQKIHSLLPIRESTITDYHLFFVHGKNDFEGLEIVGAMVSEALTQ